MTCVAGLRVVEVPADAVVCMVNVTAVVASSAAENEVVGRIGVADRTGEVGMLAGGNREIGMHEISLVPTCIRCLVAGLAGGGES